MRHVPSGVEVTPDFHHATVRLSIPAPDGRRLAVDLGTAEALEIVRDMAQAVARISPGPHAWLDKLEYAIDSRGDR